MRRPCSPATCRRCISGSPTRCGWTLSISTWSPPSSVVFARCPSASRGGAFRYLQFESGGHRVQRVPVTETQGRIHTSAATVAILPGARGSGDRRSAPEDLQIDVMRAGDRAASTRTRPRAGCGSRTCPAVSSSTAATSGASIRTRRKPCESSEAGSTIRSRRRLVPNVRRPGATLIGSGDRSQRIRTYNFLKIA